MLPPTTLALFKRPTTHTIIISNPAVIVVTPLIFNNLNYDPDADLLAWAKANPTDFDIAVHLVCLPHFLQSDLPQIAANSTEAIARIKDFKQQWNPVITGSGYKVDQQ